MNSEELIPELAGFLKIVDGINGLYLDAITAFFQWRKKFIEDQHQISDKMGMPITELDKKPFAYGQIVSQVELIVNHQCTQKEYKERLKENGLNYSKIANLCIVSIYQYWEYHRNKIGENYNLDKNSIVSDLMGDIRFYRNSIVHNKGVGNDDMDKCKILSWFKGGDEINLTKVQFKSLLMQINNEMIAIHNKYFK